MSLQSCKITVVKRFFHEDLISEFLDTTEEAFGMCDLFHEGQTFVVEDITEVPAGFCPWAWADIRHHLFLVASGGRMPWFKNPNMMISGCTDWFRPVIFKIERLDDED